MLNKFTLAATIALSTAPAFAHEAIVEHAHTESGLTVYAIPAAILFAAAAVLGVAVFLTRRPASTKNKSRKS